MTVLKKGTLLEKAGIISPAGNAHENRSRCPQDAGDSYRYKDEDGGPSLVTVRDNLPEFPGETQTP